MNIVNVISKSTLLKKSSTQALRWKLAHPDRTMCLDQRIQEATVTALNICETFKVLNQDMSAWKLNKDLFRVQIRSTKSKKYK